METKKMDREDVLFYTKMAGAVVGLTVSLYHFREVLSEARNWVQIPERFKTYYYVGIAGIFLALIGLGVWYYFNRETSKATATSPQPEIVYPGESPATA